MHKDLKDLMRTFRNQDGRTRSEGTMKDWILAPRFDGFGANF